MTIESRLITRVVPASTPARPAVGRFPRQLNISLYVAKPVEYLPYNSQARRVAKLVGDLIAEAAANLSVEHIGSTAVPGCWGKGIVDLLVMYEAQGLENARDALDSLGFQRQSGPNSFPESRPMRVGSVDHLGRTFRIHAHVLEKSSSEASNLIEFRDLLRGSSILRRAYEAEKLRILARGISNGSEYSNAKGRFIRHALSLPAEY